MTHLTLYIANKNYSSWSFRAWLGLKATNLEFTEQIILLKQTRTHTAIMAASPSGILPCLHHQNERIWDSLAILEYIHELAPEKKLLPDSRSLRALIRSTCTEMHSGFSALRQQCPMNMRRQAAKEISSATQQDLQRIYELWSLVKNHPDRSEGPYLWQVNLVLWMLIFPPWWVALSAIN